MNLVGRFLARKTQAAYARVMELEIPANDEGRRRRLLRIKAHRYPATACGFEERPLRAIAPYLRDGGGFSSSPTLFVWREGSRRINSAAAADHEKAK